MNSNPYEFDFQTSDRWHPSLLRSLRHWMAEWREQRRVRREIQCLQELSDYLLQDVGLMRADLSEDRQLKNAAKRRSANQN